MCIQSKTLLNIYWNGYWIQMDKYRKLLHRKRSIIFATTTTTWWRSYASVTIQVGSRIFLTAVSLVGSRGGCWSLSQLHTGGRKGTPLWERLWEQCLARCTSAVLWRCAGTSPVTSTSSNSSGTMRGNTVAASKNTSYANSRAIERGGPWKLILSSGTLCASPIDLFTRSNKDN